MSHHNSIFIKYSTDIYFRMYNPLVYAVEAHCSYVCKYGNSEKPILFIGMSASPYGMAQTGVPLGNLKHVRNYLGLTDFDVKYVFSSHLFHSFTFWKIFEINFKPLLLLKIVRMIFFKNCAIDNCHSLAMVHPIYIAIVANKLRKRRQ